MQRLRLNLYPDTLFQCKSTRPVSSTIIPARDFKQCGVKGHGRIMYDNADADADDDDDDDDDDNGDDDDDDDDGSECC